MAKHTNKDTTIPEELRQQLELFKKQLWKIKVTEVILAGFFGLILSFILLLLVERFVEIPLWLRIVNLIIGISIFAFIAPVWINKWILKHRRENQIAHLISKKFPHLGDQILGVVELEGQKVLNVSEELRAAAMRKVTADAKLRNLNDALPSSKTGRWLIGVSIAIVTVVVACFFLPMDGVIASVKRWAAPWSDTERFTFTKIDTSRYVDGLIVPINEPFQLELSLQEDSRPESEGSVRLGQEPWQKSYFESGLIQFAFAGKTQPSSIDIRIGDAAEQISVIPTSRPILKQTNATIQWPEYLNRATEDNVQFASGTIQPLVGSTITLSGIADKALQSATASKVYRLARPGEEVVGEDETFIDTTIPLQATVSDKVITSIPIHIGNDTLQFSLNWIDQYGLEAKKSATYRIEPIQDAAPSPYIEADEQEYIQLISHPLTFFTSATDDYGIDAYGFSWQGYQFDNNASPASKGERVEYSPTTDSFRETSLNNDIIFDPQANGIREPQTLVFTTWVEDQLPGRGRVVSESKVTVHLYSVEMMIDHNNKTLEELKNKSEEILEATNENIEQLENLQKLEEKTNEKAKSSDPTEKQNALKKLKDIRQQIEEIQDSEKQLQKDTEELTEKTKELFQQAAQDKTLKPDALKDVLQMQKALEKASEAKEQAQSEIQEAGEEIEKEKPEESMAQEKIEEALEQLKKSKEAIAKATEKAKDAKESGELASFVNRIKQASRDQREVKTNLLSIHEKLASQDIDLQMLGRDFQDYTTSQQDEIDSIYKSQLKIERDLDWIYEDLSIYYARTKKAPLKPIIEAMLNVPIDDPAKPDAVTSFDKGMDELVNNLESSHWMQTIDYADAWANEINNWADTLANANSANSGGGGGGGGGDTINDDDFNFMLRVLSVVKQQQIIRAKTRALEQQKRSLQPTPLNS